MEDPLIDVAVRLTRVTKAFSGHAAVRDLSLSIPRGSVFGLLGPNGAGKTTTLRMIMNILAPDSGTIEILGRPADAGTRDVIGYMPEERGLYPRMVLEEQLLFLAELKGVRRTDAAARLPAWLDRLGLLAWRRRRVNELSKGMQQKAQFIAAILHEPAILILDEPTSGLDPVAADLMGGLLLERRRAGLTVVLSSHQMDTVERLCDAISLMNRGEKLLEGAVADVKRQHGKNTVVLAYEGDGGFLASLPGVVDVKDFGRHVELRLEEGCDPQSLLREATQRLRVSRFEILEPSLHTIFLERVAAHGAAAA